MGSVQFFDAIIKSFKINASCIDFKQLDNYFYYDIKLNPSAKVKDIQKYSDEFSLALQTPCKPSVQILHDKGIVRLEFISTHNKILKLFDYFTNTNLPNGKINCLLGQMVDGSPMWMDLAQNPHMIIAGTTGSGKSTLLHNIIANLLNYNDSDIYLIDPKKIEFSEYKAHFSKIPVYTTYDDVLIMLRDIIHVMEFRYDAISKNENVNLKPIVIIIDEFADLIMQDKNDMFYNILCQLAQKCRAASIHLILSTQRPSVDIISGAIKANFPARISCRVASHFDSKVILNTIGAENLLGKGDALVRDNLRFSERFQIAYTDAKEVCSYFGE